MFFLAEHPPKRMIVQMEDVDDFDDETGTSYSVPQQARAIPYTNSLQENKAHINVAAKMITNKERSINTPKIENKPTYITKTGGLAGLPTNSSYASYNNQNKIENKPKIQGRLLENISNLLKQQNLKQEPQNTMNHERRRPAPIAQDTFDDYENDLPAPRIPKRQKIDDSIFNNDVVKEIPKPDHQGYGRKRLLG